jgi:nucleoside-diphosphate-sugar epimerase
MGFIGSNLARRLVNAGAEVTLVDSLIPEYGGNARNISDIRDRLRVNISDVRDQHSFRHLVDGQDILFNLAGQTSHMDSMADPFTDLDINCRSQLSILETCRMVNPAVKIVFASTRQMYGRPDYLPVDEDHLLRPTDVNGINKMAGEWYHILYNNVHGIRACALRLTNTYGPGMRVKDARQTFLGIWIRLLLQDQAFQVWGGDQLRDFNHVDDVVDAMLLAAGTDATNGQAYNLGDPQVLSLKDLARTLIDANGGAGSFEVRDFPEDRRRIDIGDYYADFSRLAALGWTPSRNLADGLSQTLDHYRAHLNDYL